MELGGIMIVKCKEEHRKLLIRFLKQDVVFNTFILADIDNYGFDSPFQEIYMKQKGDECNFVYLKFYNNLIISGEPEEFDIEFAEDLMREGISIVMGRNNLVCQIAEGCKNYFNHTKKVLYQLEMKENLLKEDGTVQIASEKDVERIYNFLMSIESFKALYSSKDMIYNRIRNGEGIHAFIENEGEIIAHGNSTAKSEFSYMIGGVGVKDSFRNQGLASKIVSKLADNILAEKKIPCIFSEKSKGQSFLGRLGFMEIGDWGTLELKML